MDISDVVISDWALELCVRWEVNHDELVRARVEGSVFFPESAIEEGWVVIWGPARADGTHLYIVCGPKVYIINDFRPLESKPVFDKALLSIRPV